MDIALFYQRAKIFKNTRAFFDRHDYLEVDTPLLAPNLIPETCLEVFKTTYINPASGKKDKDLYLIPSPEIWMKKIIAQKRTNIYQICKCFRNGESTGKMHNPEFTMLEYYTMDADYKDSIMITETLFDELLQDSSLLQFQNQEQLDALKPPFLRLTMDEAFARYAGFSLIEAIEENSLELYAHKLGLEPPAGTSGADLYNLIFIHAVEPRLPCEKPVVLLDYPAIVPCLASLNEGKRSAGLTRQRWELYIQGIEMANCYSEEICAENIKSFFAEEGALKKQSAQVQHDIDEDYWKLFLPRKNPAGDFESFPHCSGVALGMDRLIMLLTGRKTIDGVLPFQLSWQVLQQKL